MRRGSRLLTRLALALARTVGRRPLPTSRRMTRWMAGPLRRAMRGRAAVAERNLELCFPELDRAARADLLRRHFVQLAEMVGELCHAWTRESPLDDDAGEVVGLHHLERARAEGRGVLLVTGHCCCLEIGGRLFFERVPAHGIYRPLSDPLLEGFQNAGRARYAAGMIAHRDLRAMVRHLRSGGVLWYAPDQDFGRERSLFAPFFGIPTATARGIVELARMGRAAVVPMYPVKDEETGRVTVHVEPELKPFPSGDDAGDLARVNAFLERRVREAPDQYWWLHRRFKTAPDSGEDRYTPRADSG